MENANMEERQESTLAQLARAREEAKGTARTGQGGSTRDENEELPEGAAPIEARAESDAVETEAAPQRKEEETLITIGGQTFKTQREAIAYAEQLEREKLLAEAHAAGIQEALRATRPIPQEEPVEDNFEEKFYANPKEALREVEERATKKALEQIERTTNRENLWKQFFDENPDLAGSRQICEMVLNQNWDTLGQMTDVPKAMKVLATKTRSLFQSYNDRMKPRTELPNKSGQVLSTGGNVRPNVTPQKKDDAPLDFVSEMKRMKSRA